MICDQLPNTGAGASIGLLAAIAVACLLLGGIFVARRHSLGVAAAVVIVIVVGSAAVVFPAQPARAEAAHCSSRPAAVSVIQTSVMNGLAPGIAPAAITGLVENTGTAAIHVIAVEVAITGVTAPPGSAAGTCDPTDYLILDSRMAVDRSLDAGHSTPFDGASIGFSDKPIAQDACQNAIVHLLYTVQATEL